MGTFIFALLLSVLSFNGNAQSNYEKQMTEALEHWENNRMEEATLLFEKASAAEPDNWLPHYYSSLIRVTETFKMADRERKKTQLDQALAYLKEAERLKGKGHVELILLRAMWNTGYITLNPEIYGPELYHVVSNLYARAQQIAPQNPRVVLSMAEWNMGAAPYLGTDSSSYCKDVTRSLPLFKSFEPEEPFAPDWGEGRARNLLATTCGG